VITALALSPALDVTYLLDEFTLDVINRPTKVLRLPGGKAINAARAIAALGSPSAVIAPLGGHIGDLIEALLADSGLALTRIATRGETRSCVTIASAEAGALTELYEPSTPLGELAWHGIERAVADIRPSPGDWLALSGSIPADVDLDRLTDLMTDAAARGFRLAIDTHGDALAALVNGANPHLVKVNRSEATALLALETDVSLDTLADSIRRLGGGLVVVTDGVAGSLAVDDSGSYRVEPDAVIGRFAVGSGDCFLGGLLAALDRGESVREALTLAAACASSNASTPGAANFDATDVDARRRGVVITRADPTG
jgi:1-phosphofructokinase family hexose kinase